MSQMFWVCEKVVSYVNVFSKKWNTIVCERDGWLTKSKPKRIIWSSKRRFYYVEKLAIFLCVTQCNTHYHVILTKEKIRCILPWKHTK
mmetsp:Transcript_7158/g.13246  ORF Transcript_7158/g.13246 Transcript_7158/m.13246 type:complete len:88 (-) Transcript_7158:903-1166(-)